VQPALIAREKVELLLALAVLQVTFAKNKLIHKNQQ
jgi:hypothetical protein